MHNTANIAELQQRIRTLEQENALLRRDFHLLSQGSSVLVPDALKPVFDIAEQTVGAYFRELSMDPAKGTIEINDQRYVLVRASALSKDFLDTIQRLYADRGAAEAFSIGKNFLFDIAHVIGMNDAQNFHAKMNLTDPIAKLSAGPVHFAYSGWAFVDILPESHPTPDDDFCLVYRHPYSFEADSWQRSGAPADMPVCIMNSGYSSGWCEESFGIPLTAVEVSCRAMGDEHCTFIMSPPHKIQEHLDRYQAQNKNDYHAQHQYEIPTFFERKKVEEEMQRARLIAEASAKAKSDFVANVSHELRTPLNAILGFAELMDKTGLDLAQKDYMEAISSSGNSLLAIINDILDLSKLDADKLLVQKMPFNMQELLAAVQVMLQPKAAAQGLEFHCTVDAAVPGLLSGDPMRLRQVLVNLIGNAIKFTHEGSVSVQCLLQRIVGQSVYVIFRIKDTGIGIPATQLETIFERFNQGDNDTTRKYGGTGLGLAIARQLVLLLGGTLSVQSEQGSGSEFIVELPFDLATESVKGGDRYPAATKAGKEQTVLIVEDNLMNQKLAQVILQHNGFGTAITNNGSEALELLKQQNFDLILMDIQMPVMDGCQAARAIRKELKIHTPIIAMTAFALDSEREQCIREGMNDYLAKPFREQDLLHKIAHWLPESEDAKADRKSLISFTFLKEQTGNNIEFIEEMVSLFLQHNPGHIRDLEAAIARQDFEAVRKLTHVLRNEVSFFDLQAVIGDQLRHMEQLAGDCGDIKEIDLLSVTVKTVCMQAVGELQQSVQDKTYRNLQ